jgi:hypothetical protein
MCLGTGLAILGLTGVATSAVGTIFSGITSSEAASYQAQVAKNNAIIANQNANYSEAAGQAQAEATGLKGAAKAGNVKASIAANNIDVNSGSAKNVETSEAETNQLNTEAVLNNAALQSYGYRTQATGYTAQAGLEQFESETAIPAAVVGAGGNLLSQASSVGFKWGQQNGYGTNLLPAISNSSFGFTND